MIDSILMQCRQLYKHVEKLHKEIGSDTAMIESLNRYIEALEGKVKMQEGMIRELREQLKSLVPGK